VHLLFKTAGPKVFFAGLFLLATFLILVCLGLHKSLAVIHGFLRHPRGRRFFWGTAGMLLLVMAGINNLTTGAAFTRGAFGALRRVAEEVRFVLNIGAYRRQFLSEAPKTGLGANPPRAIERLEGNDVYLFFIESYGQTVFGKPEHLDLFEPALRRFEKDMSAAGFAIVSNFVESPVYGGASWLAHATVAGQSHVKSLDNRFEAWENTLVNSMPRGLPMTQNVCTSIIENFSALPDPRILLKTRHKLVDIVTMTLCAVIAGADDWVEIAFYARAKEAWFRSFLELPGGIPSHDTFGRVFSLLKPEAFAKCYIDWVRGLVNISDELVAVDGKTVRRSHDRANGKSAIHMVNAWAVHHGLVLGQVKTDDKSNEIKAIPELLKHLDLEGCVVSIDAMGCQKDIAKEVVEQGADYVFSLKGNQGNLHKDVELFFQDAKKNDFKDIVHDTHTSVDGEHGRIETRHYTTVADVHWFEEKGKWAKLTSFGMVEAQRELNGQISTETRYYISSLPSDAKRFAAAARGHWAVENSLHWCLDIAFREDDSRVRTGHAPENLAMIRALALTLIKRDPHRKIGVKASRKRAGWDMEYLKKLIGVAVE
jgi:predicted transposase YbfD/YdcC